MGNVVSFRREFGLILVGAIIFTASFLWKDLLSDIEEKYFPKNHGLAGRAIYTIIITIILIMVAVHLRNTLGLSNSSQSPIRFDDQPINNPNDEISDTDY